MIIIAKLGGYLHRTCDGHPGFECLWKGYASLETMVRMMQLYHRSHSKSLQPMRRRKFMGHAQP